MMVLNKKKERIIKVIAMYPEGGMNVFMQFYGNQRNSCWDIHSELQMSTSWWHQRKSQDL